MTVEATRHTVLAVAAADVVYRYGGARAAIRQSLGINPRPGLARRTASGLLALLTAREELSTAAALAQPRGGEQG